MSEIKPHIAFAEGWGIWSDEGSWISARFPSPQLLPLNTSLPHSIDNALLAQKSQLLSLSPPEKRNRYLAVACRTDIPPTTAMDAYLRLHLLSHRLLKPNQVNLDDIFTVLPTVAFTHRGVFTLNELDKELKKTDSEVHIYSIDKFPALCDYVVPTGVRIADARRVRLGAYLGEGTTVMHEGFVNYNAGTEGPNMVEGRISAGVFVAAHSDLGGGCSIMGTLSGGNQTQISVGQHCLIGANAGIGISLGNGCTIEAGLYLTAGAIVSVLDEHNHPQKTVKAKDLSQHDNLLFRRHSLNGRIECLPNPHPIALNPQLH